MIWGLVAHLVADWLLQNDWMSRNKVKPWHPAGYIHAGIHGLIFWPLFGGWVALALAAAHLLIDFRKPVQWWSKLIRQTQPKNKIYYQKFLTWQDVEEIPLYDIGLEVRIWTDQVFHILCVAIAALLVA